MITDEIEIKEESPFEHDLLKREEEIVNLSDLILTVDSPFVLSVDSPWGSGKTTFIRLWKAYLKNKFNFDSIYFNAWESDYSEDPIIPLVSAIDEHIEQNDQKRNKAWKTTKKILPAIFKSSAVAAAKVATLGSLELDKEYEKIVSDAVGDLTGDLIESYKNKKRIIAKFQELLSDILQSKSEQQHSIIIFIDELDRCRPDYAINLLERIKHLLNIKGIIFVLSTDLEQLSHSIKSVYGEGFDSKKYLKRFISIEYTLNKSNLNDYITAIVNAPNFSEQFSKRQYNYSNNFKESLLIFSLKFKIKPRDINQICARIFLILKSITPNQYMDIELITALIFLRDKNRELYDDYISQPTAAPKVVDFLINDLDGNHKYSYISAKITGSLLSTGRPELYDKEEIFEKLLEPYKALAETKEYTKEKEWARKVIMCARDPDGRFNINIDNIHKKVELLSKIQINNL